jgi:hypothetical protein
MQSFLFSLGHLFLENETWMCLNLEKCGADKGYQLVKLLGAIIPLPISNET